MLGRVIEDQRLALAPVRVSGPTRIAARLGDDQPEMVTKNGGVLIADMGLDVSAGFETREGRRGQVGNPFQDPRRLRTEPQFFSSSCGRKA